MKPEQAELVYNLWDKRRILESHIRNLKYCKTVIAEGKDNNNKTHFTITFQSGGGFEILQKDAQEFLSNSLAEKEDALFHVLVEIENFHIE